MARNRWTATIVATILVGGCSTADDGATAPDPTDATIATVPTTSPSTEATTLSTAAVSPDSSDDEFGVVDVPVSLSELPPFVPLDANDVGTLAASIGDSAWTQVIALGGQDGATTAEQAAAAFALSFGSFPGAPAIEPDASVPPSATHAIEWVREHFDEYDAPTRQWLTEHPVFRDYPIGTDGDDIDGETDEASQDADGTDTVVLAAYGTPGPSDDPSDAVSESFPSLTERRAWNRLLDELRLGVEARFPSIGRLDISEPLFYEPNGGNTGAWSDPKWLAGGVYDGCGLHIWNLRDRDPRVMAAGLAHELVHCAVAELAGARSTYQRLPLFFGEGFVSWAGELIGGPSNYLVGHWIHHQVGDPLGSYSVYAGSYDAIGFWSILASRGADLFGAAPDLVRRGSGDPQGLYELALTLVDGEGASQLASAPMLMGDLGSTWDHSDPSMPSIGRTFFDVLTLAPGGTSSGGVGAALGFVDLNSPAATHRAWRVTLDARGEESVVVGVDGTGTVRARWEADGSDGTFVGSGVLQWCVGEPCVCPDGSEAAPGAEPAPPGATDLVVAVSGQSSAPADVRVSARSLDDLCEPECDPPAGFAKAVVRSAPVCEPGESSDIGLVGEWRATAGAREVLFDATFRDTGVDPQFLAGDAFITFREDRSGTLLYDDMTYNLPSDGLGDLIVQFNGGGEFAWTADGTNLTVDFSSFEIVPLIYLGDQQFPFGSFSDADFPTPGGTLTYVVGADLLSTLHDQGGAVAFPSAWTRAI